MKAFLKNPIKMAGLLLLLVWLTFSVYNLSYSLPQWKELAPDLANETNLAGVVQDVDEFVQEKVVLRQPMMEAHSLMQMALGKREVNNLEKVKDRLGYLHGGNFYVGFGDDQRKIAINFRLLTDYAAQYGAKTSVVITPMKVAPENARYAGLPYNSFYPEAETLLAWLRHYNVSCLDLRDLPEWSGLGYEGSFYKTDRHWTTPAAFAGYCRILDWLEQTQGLGLDPGGITRNLDNYTVQNYPSIMFGSTGRDVGLFFSGGAEDFSMYYPLDDGSYSMYTEDDDEWREYSGGFRGTLVDDAFETAAQQNIFRYSCYDISFLHGLDDFTSIQNNNNLTGPRILMLRDSYASPLGCYLAQNCSQLDMVYILGGRMQDALDMIRENEYDYVIVCIYPVNLSIENCRLFEDLDYDA